MAWRRHDLNIDENNVQGCNINLKADVTMWFSFLIPTASDPGHVLCQHTHCGLCDLGGDGTFFEYNGLACGKSLSLCL